MISLLLILAGFVALYFGAEWLVKGSTAMALRLGLPPLLVGLTVVAYGTSSPEMVVSVVASVVAGSRAFVIGASDLARMWGVSEALIGLSIVSIGTSLPELASSLLATCRKQADIAVGNVVGSNIFNILSIAGVSRLVKPIHAPGIQLKDFYAMIGTAGLLPVLAWTSFRIRRWEGALLLAVYAGYLAWLWPK